MAITTCTTITIPAIRATSPRVDQIGGLSTWDYSSSLIGSLSQTVQMKGVVLPSAVSRSISLSANKTQRYDVTDLL